jgi:hypothetical protein
MQAKGVFKHFSQNEAKFGSSFKGLFQRRRLGNLANLLA